MGLLDRIRSQPAWQHADPAVRASAIAALTEDQSEVLATVARHDSDAAVRRAAVNRLTDAPLLAEIARADLDAGVRDEAIGVLVGLALGARDESLGRRAAAAVEDSRLLANIAKSSVLESVCRAALDRVDDQRLLSNIARRALNPVVRIAALERMTGDAELASVALRTDYRDVASAALDRITSHEHLAAVSTRAHNKAIARRAGARLRALRGPVEPVSAPAPPTDRRRQIELCTRIEELARSGTADRLGIELREAQDGWNDLVPDVDDDLVERFSAACEAARARQGTFEAERLDRERQDRIAREHRDRRLALCDAVGQLGDDDMPARLADIRRQWQELPSWDSGEHDRLSDRFEAACAMRERQRADAMAARPALIALCEEAERLAESHSERASMPERAAALRREWRSRLATLAPANRDLAERFTAADAWLAKQELEARDAFLRQQRADLERLETLTRDSEALLTSSSPSLKEIERRYREIRTMLEFMPRLPSRRDHDRLAAQLRELGARMGPRLQELREVVEWERWANAGVQEDLCARAELLVAAGDPLDALRQLHQIEAQWKAARSAPPERSQALWRRFRTAASQIRERSGRILAEQAEEQARHLAGKLALSERAESLAESTDWLRTAEVIKQLQAEWKTIGPVTRGQEKAVWERFRRSCDRFFTRRHEDLARRKAEWGANLARKEGLCARVEALADPSDWNAALTEVRRLQAEWRTVGPVRRNRSEAVWDRFRAACDRFFERYRQRDQLEQTTQDAKRDRLIERLDSFRALGAASTSVNEVVATLRDIWNQGQGAGSLPRDHAAAWHGRFLSAFEEAVDAHRAELAGSEFDVERNAERLEDLCGRVERLVAGHEAVESSSPAAKLATMWREALASNTIGGKVEAETTARAGIEEVRDAQAAWRRVGFVPEAKRARLSSRFDRACHRFFDQRRNSPTGR